MDILTFIITVIAVTASGALAPGPLFFANVAQGIKSGAKSGLAFSVAHSIIEFSLIMLLAFGVLSVANESSVKLTIGVASGIALLAFGVLQIHGAVSSKPTQSSRSRMRLENNFLIGLLFTGLNPYFILWWLTVGLKLISDAWALASWAGIIILFVAHIWMDYAWLTATAYLAKKGTNLVGSKGYKIMMILFGIILFFFGLYYLASLL